MPDVEEFPDGGRATLVRRYSPPLTDNQLHILAVCPYDAPVSLDARMKRTALPLVAAGLLERHPESKNLFRCTEAGTQVVARWRAAGLLP